MDTAKQKSFDFYLEVTKQLMALSSGIIAFTVVFAKDFMGLTSLSGSVVILALGSWCCFLVSIIFGILSISTMVGELDPGPDTKKDHSPSIWAKPIGFTIKGQQITFVLGVILILVFGAVSVVNGEQTKSKKARCQHQITARHLTSMS